MEDEARKPAWAKEDIKSGRGKEVPGIKIR